MKQTISLAIILFALPVLADVQWKDGPYTYTVADSQATIIAFDTNYSGDISIPAGLPELEWGGYPVIAIADYAFYDSKNVTSITVPDNVINIGDYAFGNCTSVTNFTFGHGVAALGPYALSGCESLLSVTIPAGLAAIGDYAFLGCVALTRIDVDPAHPTFSSVDGVWFDKAQTTLIQYPAAKADDSYVVPDSVAVIRRYAFAWCSVLTTITIPDSVTAIENWVFYYCSALTGITLPDSLTTIGAYAFYSCAALTRLRVPDSLTTIGAYAFKWCSSLATVIIGNSVTAVGRYAFESCSALTSVYFRGEPPTPGVAVFRDTPATIYYLPQHAAQWPATYADRPTVLWNPIFTAAAISADAISCTITGTANIPVAFEATTNLLTGPWLRLHTTNLTSGLLDFTDSAATNFPARFYRIAAP